MAQSQGGWRRLVLHQWTASRSGVIWDPSSIPGQRGGLHIPGQIKILFIPGHFQDSVYTRWCSFTQTSVRGATSAWTADTRLSSDCDGVCVTAFVKRISWAMTLVGAGWYHQSQRL